MNFIRSVPTPGHFFESGFFFSRVGSGSSSILAGVHSGVDIIYTGPSSDIFLIFILPSLKTVTFFSSQTYSPYLKMVSSESSIHNFENFAQNNFRKKLPMTIFPEFSHQTCHKKKREQINDPIKRLKGKCITNF